MRRISLALSAGPLVLGPMLAATIRDHRDAIRQARTGALEPVEMLDLTCQLAWACARRVDSAVTLEQIEGLVDMENAPEVFAACWGVSVPEPAPGETPAVQATQST